MGQSSIFWKYVSATGLKVECAVALWSFRDALTPDQPWGKNWPSAQYFPLMKKRPAIMMNTHTARFSTLRTLLKPTEFFTPSATMMVTMIAITRARRSGYDSSPFPRGQRHELTLSRGKKGPCKLTAPRQGTCSQLWQGWSLYHGGRRSKYVQTCMCVHVCVCVQVYMCVHMCLHCGPQVSICKWEGFGM